MRSRRGEGINDAPEADLPADGLPVRQSSGLRPSVRPSGRSYDVITFDCYGTLIDWERGIGDAVLTAAAADGVRLDRAGVLSAYAEIEPVVEAEGFRSYREVLTESVRRLAARLHWPLPHARAGFLAASLPAWPPFPDTNGALRRMAAAGLRLGVLSNVDDDLFAGTRTHLSASFEFVITAAQVRSYKPAH
ncbi:MAG TPA: HAD family hydrolase, partial [Gemmatimonadales bacterium]|nr:HAD family hydrolase [Gemmatimonadales bacterium]